MKTASVIDVARDAGVSPSTVCRALNGRGEINTSTRTRIISAARRLGYVRNAAASNLRLRRSDTIACLIRDGDNELHIDKLHLLRREAAAAGYRFALSPYRNDEERAELFGRIVAERPAGLVLKARLDAAERKVLARTRLATVVYDGDEAGLDSVSLDRARGVREAVAHLLELGRRRIVLLGSRLDEERGVAYAEALRAAGVRIDPALVVDAEFGRDLYAYGYEQTGGLAGRAGFDAMVCVNDACAIGAVRALHERGTGVPDRVSVVGFDNIVASRYVTPTISTVAQPIEEMAANALELLTARVAHPDAPRRIVRLATSFVRRESA